MIKVVGAAGVTATATADDSTSEISNRPIDFIICHRF
tara:strand:+ start:1078 stop:1188 length:111 start_codon:yes stop_codon:yes gene_type:complete